MARSVNVKSNLLELKNLTGVIVDLAYSALLLEDKKLKVHVEELYERLMELELETIDTIFKVKGMKETKLLVIKLMDNMTDLADAAVSISGNLDNFKIPSLIKDVLSKTDERVIVCKVSSKSGIAGKKLRESNLQSKVGLRIIGIKRKGSWIFNVNGDTKIMPKDLIVSSGSENCRKKLQKITSGKRV